ncbi:MAG: dihydroneopterin aldolase [Muribaculaceae bacterium]|nr:dihydroneopterin aldolase [Muribaculaceae bacterium]
MVCNETFIIRLEGLNFFSSIGVGHQELMVGNEFLVDCEFELPAEGFMSEILESTVSYADVYALIESIMRRKWLLLESVAKAIGDECKSKWPGISRISVKVKKVSPPIRGIQGSCSVEYRKNE